MYSLKFFIFLFLPSLPKKIACVCHHYCLMHDSRNLFPSMFIGNENVRLCPPPQSRKRKMGQCSSSTIYCFSDFTSTNLLPCFYYFFFLASCFYAFIVFSCFTFDVPHNL
ncbi:hypothetical protein V6Z11_A10G225400 [Gossypium hirsutum]